MTMLAEHLEKDEFRLRGTAMSRVDGFSDVVFGFALTILVVSLEVPKTFDELHAMLSGFFPFAVSFVLLLTIWYAHFQFFRRYGLEDLTTIALNAGLLFVVLFFVYPLKFLFSVMASTDTTKRISDAQTAQLMLLYGSGFAAIYLLFAALYWNAWRKRDALGLNMIEQVLTKGSLLDHLAEAGVGVIACLLAVLLPARWAGMSGFAYFLVAATKTAVGVWTGKRVRQVRRGMGAGVAVGASE